ncbi:hypothetical protein [Zooshikella harenae]|uniref:DUF2269 family protein n=1 Tax=Zooshikella harenae TaxID=2827238 RepID=A0ABS5ZHA8_9GAMM|nr:hypothetical protein [Zooshikella harenae]MBU2713439.1 hypothetical protein [Zooshikella harenae]
MRSLVKTIHLIALAVFLGSIITYIFAGVFIPEGNAHALTLNRQFVFTGTKLLTIPAMLVTGITGLLLMGKPNQRWLWVKLIGFVVIALNTYLFIYPAIDDSVAFLSENKIELFDGALMKEAIFGALNILLIIALVFVATKKPSFFANRKAN